MVDDFIEVEHPSNIGLVEAVLFRGDEAILEKVEGLPVRNLLVGDAPLFGDDVSRLKLGGMSQGPRRGVNGGARNENLVGEEGDEEENGGYPWGRDSAEERVLAAHQTFVQWGVFTIICNAWIYVSVVLVVQLGSDFADERFSFYMSWSECGAHLLSICPIWWGISLREMRACDAYTEV